tara:strand:- start:143 stop:400 length:258 start_codon:yes stop_codon:yes gene_type:complete
MNELVEHRINSENDNWIYGKTYINNTYFGDWCRYKKSGNPPITEQLIEIERKRVEIAKEYLKNNPREPSKEYYEAIKRWPLKEIK